MPEQNKQSGFTLIELTLVLIFAGFIGLTTASFFKHYTQGLKRQKTTESIELAQAALFEYYVRAGVYPCPADPTLNPGDPNYGVSQCRDFAAPTYSPENCADMPSPNIVCTNDSSRDADASGNNDIVTIGALPFQTIYDFLNPVNVDRRNTPFTLAHRADGYGTLLSYAITENLTNTQRYSTFNAAPSSRGAIRIVDENDLNLTDPPDSAHYALFSHGDNRRGGYSISGVQIENCNLPAIVIPGGPPPPPAGPPPPGPSIGAPGVDVEIENCDYNDAIFVKGIYSTADDNSYNDDKLVYETEGYNPLWLRSPFSTSSAAYIYNTNLGNVGVGMNAPTHKLHIQGDLNVEESTRALEGYCEGNDPNLCVYPDFFGGVRIERADGNLRVANTCPPGQAAYAIGRMETVPVPGEPPVFGNELKCRDVTWQPINRTCNPIGGIQSFLRGVSNLGTVLCCTTHNACERQCAAGTGAACDP